MLLQEKVQQLNLVSLSDGMNLSGLFTSNSFQTAGDF